MEWITPRFWSKVHKTDSCWLWVGTKRNKLGYGVLRVPTGIPYKRKKISAHHVSWIIHNGPIPHGLIICHKCDNPPCVNPNHLFLGTHRDNTMDAFAKGRRPLGSKVKTAKLTDWQVCAIRAMYPAKTQTWLAKQFGVSQPMIGMIVRRDSWAWLP